MGAGVWIIITERSLRLSELKICFLNSGYPKKLVDTVLDDVVKRPRNLFYKSNPEKKPPNKVLWVQTFCPATPLIKKLVKETNKIYTEKLSGLA